MFVVLAWVVPPWVLKTLAALILAVGIGAALLIWNKLRSAPDDAFSLATGYAELEGLKGKHPTQSDVAALLDRLDLSKENLEILYEGYNKRQKSTPTSFGETIIVVLSKRIQDLNEEE